MMRKLLRFILPLLFLFAAACADQTTNLSDLATFTQDGHAFRDVRRCLDGDYRTYASLSPGKVLVIDCGGLEMGYLQIRHYDRAVPYEIDVFNGKKWIVLGNGGDFLSEGYVLPKGAQRIEIHNTSNGRLFLCELGLYSTGPRPEDVQTWHTGGDCDLMLISCHPDDELLWFSGLLPTYAGERQLEVQPVTLVPSTPYRRLELLDALWHCGVTRYPSLLGFGDTVGSTMASQYKRWGKDAVERSIVKQLRMYRPKVVVTHDVAGEYGHAGHQVAADATIRSVEMAADARKYPPSAEEFGTWQVQKLYVHLWKENQITMDWSVPLSRFGGRTGMEVAVEAFSFHDSQIRRGWAMEEGGPCDSRLFGLYMTCVGPDTGRGDFMEHLDCPEAEPESLSAPSGTDLPEDEEIPYLVSSEEEDAVLITPTDLAPPSPSPSPSPSPEPDQERPIVIKVIEEEIDSLPEP